MSLTRFSYRDTSTSSGLRSLPQTPPGPSQQLNNLRHLDQQRFMSPPPHLETNAILFQWAENRRKDSLRSLYGPSPRIPRRLLPKTPVENRRNKRTVSESDVLCRTRADVFRPREWSEESKEFFHSPKRVELRQDDSESTLGVGNEENEDQDSVKNSERSSSRLSTSSRCSSKLTRFLAANLGLSKCDGTLPSRFLSKEDSMGSQEGSEFEDQEGGNEDDQTPSPTSQRKQ